MRFIFLFLVQWTFLCVGFLSAQPIITGQHFSSADTLRGSDTVYRNWWDVKSYHITVEPSFYKRAIKGSNQITFTYAQTDNYTMQIDLQAPLRIDSIFLNETPILNYRRKSNLYYVDLKGKLPYINSYEDTRYYLTVYFSGNPIVAKNPPWDGGWIFTYDKKGRPWMSVACQGIGASVWYPCKDYQGDEPDDGAQLSIITTDQLVGVGNGRLLDTKKLPNNRQLYHWEVTNPINNYNIIPSIGHYVSIDDTYQGLNGKLDIQYWVLDYNKHLAQEHFKQVHTVLQSFEQWMGPYPFYKDGYKLIGSPHLGMEHQSGIAYGNKYKNGYQGEDLSGSGWGENWDFIITHESGHEWFGNNITAKDIADMWIHEAFTSYSETLYVESQYGAQAANEYVQGTRKKIKNDIPIIGIAGVNQAGSTDMYYKGANMIHTLRQLIEQDSLFNRMLIDINKTFRHQTIYSSQFEQYISDYTGIDLQAFFTQYLYTTQVPTLEYRKLKKHEFEFRWNNVVADFDMPVKLKDSSQWIYPTQSWQKATIDIPSFVDFSIDPNFYINIEEISRNS